MLVRKPKHAGTFYPAHPQVLHEMIMSFIVEINENFNLSDNLDKIQLDRAAISPHAGYIYSGLVAAASYSVLKLNKNIRKLIVIGPSHYVGLPGWILSDYDAFETPLGLLPVDKDLTAELVKRAQDIFVVSNEAHEPEHSVEVQIPFIQTVLNVESFVPILGGLDADRLQMGQILKDIVSTNEDIGVIISSDLSHYHPYDVANSIDAETIEAIVEGNAEFIIPERACGRLGIRAYIHMTKLLGVDRVPILYMNSGDTAGDKSAVVGYCSIVS